MQIKVVVAVVVAVVKVTTVADIQEVGTFTGVMTLRPSN